MKRLKLPVPSLNERGVALPLALVGLVSISLLVTTALLTSSTEAAISRAHQDATASLHTAEGAIQRYIGDRATAVSTSTPTVLAPVVKTTGTSGYDITVAQLAVLLERLPSDELRQRETYAILAEPTDGRGRRAAAQITVERTALPFSLNATAGLTSGGNVDVTGNSSISDGRNANCDSTAAPNALQVTAGSTITKSGSAKIEGVADTATYTKAEMVQQILGDLTLNDVVRIADIKFGPGEYGSKAESYDSNGPKPKTDRYNWGCPAGSGDPCTTVSGNSVNMGYFPIVAIDAGGGTVLIEGEHGQGILVVHNGGATIRGNFVYEGIILVEGDLEVRGTGGSGGAKLEGAVIAFGTNSTIEDSMAGNAVITYNKCIIVAAEEGANKARINSAPQTFPFALAGWQEIVQ